jgi:hypothetical protein
MRCHPLSYGLGLSAIRAAAAGHALVLHNLAVEVMLRLDDAAKVYPAVYTGVRVILVFGGWVRWVRGRLIHVNTSIVLAAPPGSLDPPAGAFLFDNNLRI